MAPKLSKSTSSQSTVSDLRSSRSSAKSVVKKGVKAITQPLKKLKRSLSIRTNSSAAGNDDDLVSVDTTQNVDADQNEDDDPRAPSVNSDRDLPIIDISSDEAEESVDLQKELGTQSFALLSSLKIANGVHR
jgi:hypothetical protein